MKSSFEIVYIVWYVHVFPSKTDLFCFHLIINVIVKIERHSFICAILFCWWLGVKAYMYQRLNEHPRLKDKNKQAQLCVIANIPAQSHTKMLCHITYRTPLCNIHVPLKTHVSKFWYWESSNFLAGLGISFFEYEGDREKENERLLNKTTQRGILSVTISIIHSIKKTSMLVWWHRRKMLLENLQNNSTWHKKSFSLWIEGYYVNNNQVFLGPTLDCVKDE